MNNTLLIDRRLEEGTDTYKVSVSKLKKVPKFISNVLKGKKIIDGLYYQIGPKIQIVSEADYSIIKYKNCFITFTDTGARLYKANTDVNIKDFLINTKIESTSGTKTDEIDLSSLHLEFVNETDINAVYIYDNLISILVG